MLHIGICDDVPQQADAFKQRLLKGNYTEQELCIHIFHSAKELLHATEKLHLLFLDVDMPGMSGIELLEQYNAHFSGTKIIFLTSHEDYVLEGYKYHLYRYFVKHKLTNETIAELFQTFERENILEQSLELPYQNNTIHIKFKDIMYIESNGSYCNVTTTTALWKCYIRLKNLLPLLPTEYFYHSHRCYVVNMKYIKEVKDSENYLIMADGYRTDISFRKKSEFKEIHTKFLLKQ